MAGTSFRVMFELPGQLLGFESRVVLQLSWHELGSERALAGIEFSESLPEVGRVAAICDWHVEGTNRGLGRFT